MGPKREPKGTQMTQLWWPWHPKGTQRRMYLNFVFWPKIGYRRSFKYMRVGALLGPTGAPWDRFWGALGYQMGAKSDFFEGLMVHPDPLHPKSLDFHPR
jgi:hypothetical protein